MEFLNFTTLIGALLLMGLVLQAFVISRLFQKVDRLSKSIKEEIKFAIQPKFIDVSPEMSDLIELAIELWRMEQRLIEVSGSLTEVQKQKLDNCVQKIKKYLEKNDIAIKDYTNEKYNEGLTLDILHEEKDPSVKEATIKETVEPSILHKGSIIKRAKIILVRNS